MSWLRELPSHALLSLILSWRIVFPLVPTAFAFMSTWHLHQRSYSMAVLSMLVCSMQKMMVKRVPAVEKSCMNCRQDLCSDLFTAFTPSMLSEHKQSQKDIKTACSGYSLCKHTHPHTLQSLYQGNPHFCWLLDSLKKNCKATFKVREMGREHTELGKVAACSLGLS